MLVLGTILTLGFLAISTFYGFVMDDIARQIFFATMATFVYVLLGDYYGK